MAPSQTKARRGKLPSWGVPVCPALSHILINTYRNNSQLFVDGQCILSKEGTTQGDPLAMAMYAIGTQPLIRTLDGIAKQVTQEVVGSAGGDRSTIWLLPEQFKDTILSEAKSC